MQVADFKRRISNGSELELSESLNVVAPGQVALEPSLAPTDWKLPVDHFSPTSLNMLQACPRQYQQRYIRGRKEAPAQARALGNAVHDALAFNFRCKLHTEHDMEPGHLVEYYDDNAWPKMLERYGGVSEIRWDAHPNDVRTLGRQMVTAYMPVAKRIIPEHVETEVKAQVPGVPVPIIGYVDLQQADGKPVIDWKTSKIAQKSLKPEWRLQGRIYSLATDRPVDWHVITKGKLPAVYTALECPDLYQQHNEKTKRASERLIQDLVGLANHYYSKFGPDDDWPMLGVGHLWRCGKYCAYTEDCPAWAGAVND
jgi:PD-(D/E)XK nuclease superfamily